MASRETNIVVLPVGCGTDRYTPHSREDFKVQAIREALGISENQLMILTAAATAPSKGGSGGHACVGADR